MDLSKECSDCKAKIYPNVALYSFRVFGRELCISCQKEERRKTLPKKLADYLNLSLYGGQKA